jgi:hypothetical protein
VTTLTDVQMHGDLSPEARERALRTILVADIFADNADQIVADLLHVPGNHVLVAVVDENHGFAGTHHVEESKIVEKVPEMEQPGGWAMVFSAGTNPVEVRRRADQMADLAKKRVEVIDKILARRAAKASTVEDAE